MEEIISANKLNSAFKVPQNGGVFSAHFFGISGPKFSDNKEIFRHPKNVGGGNFSSSVPATTLNPLI